MASLRELESQPTTRPPQPFPGPTSIHTCLLNTLTHLCVSSMRAAGAPTNSSAALRTQQHSGVAAPATKRPRTRHSSSRNTTTSSSSHEQQPQQAIAHAALAGLLVAAQCWLPLDAAAAAKAPLLPGLSPYAEARKMVYGLDVEGRIRACPSNLNPNCVATSSINDAYSPAWMAAAPTPADAAAELERAVLAAVAESELLQQQTLASGAEYRAFSAPGLYGMDVMEFLMRPDTPGAQQQLVTYRSLASQVKYVFPFQTPLSDFNAQRKRLSAVRELLPGWRTLGCELIECYQ